MRNLYYSLALIAASVLCVNEARADIVENYKMDFNKPISTTAHDFKVGSGWGHLVNKYTVYSDWYGSTDYYVKYEFNSSDGRDGSGTLKVGSQYIGDEEGYDMGNVNDLIVTPAITGKSSIYVKKSFSWSTSSSIKFYSVTLENGKYKMGDEIEVEVPTISDDWVEVKLPEQNNQYIGIRAQNLLLDDFAADKADIQLQKSLLITKVDYKGKSEVDCDAEGNFPISYEVSITNNGDIDLTEGTKGYSLSVKNYGKELIFTQPLKGNLAVGASTTVTVTGTANYAKYPNRNRYDVYEDLTNTSKYGSWIEPIPYKPVLTMRDSNDKIENGKATYAWGMLKESTDKTFEISNDGPAPLKLTSVVVPEGFTTSLAAPLTLEGHTKQQFTITMPATTPGIYSGEFKVSAEGVDDFKFNVSATVLDPSKYYVNFNDNKIPEGSYVEAGWKVDQRDAESSDNPYLLANGSQDTDDKFVTPLLKVAQGEKMTVDVARSNYYNGGDGVYLNIYYSADRTNWTLARKITADELSDERAVNYTYYYSKLKTFVIDNIPAGNYYIGFGAGYTAIDNVYGFEKVDVAHDLMLAASYMPKTAVVNNAYTATATLRNINAKEEAADSYTASLYFDGEVVATAPAQAIAGGADAEFTFSYTPHKVGAGEAYIEFKNAADNYVVTTEKVSVDVKEELPVGTVTVGNGKTSANRTGIAFYDGNSDGAHIDNLYKAEMLTKYGIAKGTKITSVTYTGTCSQDREVKVFDLTAYVGTVDAAKFEKGKGYESLQKVNVYTDKTINFVEGNTYTTTITLPEPIVWDGTSAIRVLTYVKADKYVNVKFNADDENSTSYYGNGELGNESATYSEYSTAVAEFGFQTEPSVMSGKVTWKNKAVAGATVTLTSGDVIYTGASNEEGAYSINVIQNDKKYNLTVAAPGYIDYAEKDVDLSQSINKDIALDVEPVALTVGEDGNALFSATRAIDFSLTPEVEAYVVTAVNGNYTELAPVTTVPAGTGVLVKAKAGNYSLNVVPEADAVAKNLLVATAEEYTVAASDVKKVWTLGTDTKKNVPCFVSVEGTVVPAGSAYLAAEAEVPYIYLDKASGISGINAAAGLDTKAPMYNLAGQKVNASYKGIIIQNGKKFNNK